MNALRKLIILSVSSVLLASCSESGRSSSGGASSELRSERQEHSISCHRQGQRKARSNSLLDAKYQFSRSYTGEAKLVMLCDLEVLSVQSESLASRELTVKAALPRQCGNDQTVSMVLTIPNDGENAKAMCSWSQNIISPIIEADVLRVVELME